MYIVTFVFALRKIKQENKTKKEIKIVLESEMTSFLLRHSLLGATLWGNTATGKAWFPSWYVNNIVCVNEVGLSWISVSLTPSMMMHLYTKH